MGYSTEFEGSFKINKPVDDDTYELLYGLATTRRMKRKLGPEYGIEGEFFIAKDSFFGQDETPDIIDYNSPPITQPSLWCQWLIQEDRCTIKWDEQEKFYDYVSWIVYLIDKILKPRGYIVNCKVKWSGQSPNDTETIIVTDNKVRTTYTRYGICL